MIVADERVARFVADRLGFGLCPPFTCMGIERDGEIVGGVVFNNFEGGSVHVTVAGEGWSRSFLRAVGGYVFDTLGCRRMTAVTEYPAIVDLALRLGGQVEGRLRDHFGDGRDGTIMGILRREWRYVTTDEQ